MEEIRTIIENALRIDEEDPGLVVTDVARSEDCDLGDNFMSESYTVTVQGTTGSSVYFKTRLFIKQVSKNSERLATTHMADAFHNEAFVYHKLHPLMPNISSVTPKCFHASEDLIVMSDLKTSGYKMLDKKMGMDFDHAQLVMKAIGKYHAGTYNIKMTLQEKDFNRLVSDKFDFILNKNFIIYCNASIRNGIINLKHAGDVTVDRAIRKLEQVLEQGDTYKLLAEYFSSSQLSLIAHGDLWLNNTLFSYDSDGKVREVKLLDFQFIRHCSLAIDLWTYLYTSITPELLNKEYNRLISTYIESFMDNLKILNTPSSLSPTKENIKREIDSKEFFGYLMGLWYLNSILRDWSGSPVDLDVALSTNDNFVSSIVRVSEPLSKRLVVLAKRCIARNVF